MVMSSAAPLSAELTAQLLKVLPGASIGQVYGAFALDLECVVLMQACY